MMQDVVWRNEVCTMVLRDDTKREGYAYAACFLLWRLADSFVASLDFKTLPHVPMNIGFNSSLLIYRFALWLIALLFSRSTSPSLARSPFFILPSLALRYRFQNSAYLHPDIPFHRRPTTDHLRKSSSTSPPLFPHITWGNGRAAEVFKIPGEYVVDGNFILIRFWFFLICDLLFLWFIESYISASLQARTWNVNASFTNFCFTNYFPPRCGFLSII